MMSMVRQIVVVAISLSLVACGLATSNEERMVAARTSMAEGEYRAAIIQLRNVLVEDPDHLEARLALATVLLGLNDIPTAQKELDRAIDLGGATADIERLHLNILAAKGEFTELLDALSRTEPSLPPAEILDLRGEALLGLRNGPVAEENFNEWLQLEAGAPDAIVGLAKARALQGDAVAAIEMLETLLAKHADHAAGWLALGNIHYGLRDYESAAVGFRRSIESGQPETHLIRHIFALLGLSDCEILLGNVAAARDVVAALSRYAPGMPESALQRARVFQLEGDHAAAARELIDLLNIDPNDIRIMMLLATNQWRAGNIYQAQEYLSRIVALAPGNIRARKMLAQIELQQRNTSLAVDILEPLLAENSDDTELLGLLAIADMQRGDSDVAINRLRIAAELSSGSPQAAIQLAEGYVRTGQPQEAVKLLASYPLSTQAPFKREQVLLAAYRDAGRVQDAVAEAEALVAANADNILALELAARFYLSQEMFGDARSLLERSLALAPRGIQARLMLAKLDLNQSRLDAASENFQAVFDADTKNLTASLGLIQVALESGDRNRALDLLEKAYVENPGESLPALVLANMYLEDGRNIDAMEVAATIADGDVRELSVVRSVGRIFFTAGDMRRAQEQFEIAVERSPQSVALMLDLTRALMSQRKYADAMLVTERAIATDPSSVPARVLQILTMIQLGQAGDAEQRALALAESHPSDASVALARAEALAAMGDPRRAAAAFRAAAEKGAGLNAIVRETQMRMADGNDPEPEESLVNWIAENGGDAEARKALAGLYQFQGNRDAARDTYVALATDYPDDPVILNNLAIEYQLIGDLDQALKYATDARERQPQSGSIADTLGWIYRDLGDYANGVKHLREARRMSPDNKTIEYHLAATLADAGATDEAREILARLLQSNIAFPSRGDAEQLLARL
ncbi:MAG: PEP-CTERM system TPR-repeat protein PrsT [Chromatiales bacterium]|nr:MAG: PEP-CTERM system TPR-repeat protein PrsT [Chromatiales bacterium]